MPNSSISAKFKNDSQIELSNVGRAKIKLKLEWDDDPDNAGDAIDDVSWNGINMDSPGSDGSSTSTSNVALRGTYDLSYSGQPYGKRKVNDTTICFLDDDGDDCNAYLTIQEVKQQTYTSQDAALLLNGTNGDITIDEGQSVNVAWAVTGNGNTAEGDYVKMKKDGVEVGTSTSGALTYTGLTEGTYTFRLKAYQFVGDSTIIIKHKATVAKKPTGTLSISPSGVIQNGTCGVGSSANGVTVTWTSDGNDGGVELTGDFGGVSAPTISASSRNSGSATFYPTNAGANKNIKLKVTNANGTTFTTTAVSYDVYDHCPSDFSWSDSTDNTPLNNTNRESETISISNFGPTSASDNSLPITANKSGLQVSINGGPWQNV